MPEARAEMTPQTMPTFKPSVGYIVVDADWNSAVEPYRTWNPLTLRDARSELAHFRRMNPCTKKVIVRVESTFTFVEDGVQ